MPSKGSRALFGTGLLWATARSREFECVTQMAQEPDKESIMEDYSLWQAVVAILVWWLVIGWPGAKILARMGFSGWWVLLAFVPVANIIGIWILATKPWPLERR
ncbi:hypothetical protein [Castellaniella sp.]|uniref:hypothetical protein n=1 Tax=Castellaniella sp. TaxID=1955812 RepID=UPI002AFE0655|nr:hypothetical protein [Castellaniella sp.]